MKRFLFGLAWGAGILVGGIALGLFSLRSAGTPPKEAALIRNFNAHRAEFEELRGMLQEDRRLDRVADWGIQTHDPLFLGAVSQSTFPPERYARYMALFKRVGAVGGSRGPEKDGGISISMWGWGWAGDTKHVEFSYLEREPDALVAHLYEPYRKRLPGEGWSREFKRVEGNWYLSTDIW